MTTAYPAIPYAQTDLIRNGSGVYPNKFLGFITGRTTNVNNVRVDLWEGPTTTYVFPPSPIQMRVVSTSASDTLAGTGTQKVLIHYLDTNYNPQVETVSLNGTTPVNTVATNILRVNGFHATQAGSGGVSAGNISLTNTAGTITYGYIALGYNTARQAIFTVPAGKTGYVMHWQGGSGTTTGQHFTQIELRATAHDGVLYPTSFLFIDGVATLNNGQSINYPIPIQLPATCDVKLSAISDSGSASATAVGAVFGWFE